MKKYAFWLILLAFGTLAINVSAQPNKPRRGDTSVTSTFQDVDQATSLSYTMRSDSGGSYINGTDSVVSIIQGIGDWELDLSSSPSRQVFFDFSSPIPGTNTQNVTPPSSGAYTVRFLSQCGVRPGKKLQDLRISDGTIQCPLNVRIVVGSEDYSLRFRTVEFPGSNDVLWTCTSEANNKCNGWRMESAPGGSIARLLKITTVRNKITTTEGSLFYFTFKVDLTTP